MKKLVAVLLGAALLAIPFVGCGRVEQQIDASKTQINVTTFDGGMGTEWLEETARRFNAKSDKYQVLVEDPNKDQYEIISSTIKSGVAANDIFFNVNSLYVDLAAGGYLESLEPVLKMRPDGAGGKTVREKISDPEIFLDPFTYNGTAYCLPFTDLVIGMVYDYEMFKLNDWFLYDDNGNKTVGLDGKPGTYDDGLPVTMEEFDQMVLMISGDRTLDVFNWSGNASAYLTQIVQAVHAQYDGVDNYELYYSYNGNYKDGSGDVLWSVTPEEGNKVYDMPGLQKGLEFLEKYFVNGSHTKKSEQGTVLHTDAQINYIMGSIGAAGYEKSAFHIDGEWWENEARGTFNSVAAEGRPNYEFGKHDYRMLPVPTQEGAYGTDGEGNGTVLASIENGNIFVKKQTSAEKRQGCFEFLAYTCSDEALGICTSYTGTVRPFDYEITGEQIAGMTNLQRNVMQLKAEPNVQIVRPELLKYKNPLNYMVDGVRHYDGLVDGIYQRNPCMAMMESLGGGATAAEFLQSIKDEMAENWGLFYDQYYGE